MTAGSPQLYVDSFGPTGTADDGATVQAAVNGASELGATLGAMIPLVFTPNKTYSWGEIVPKSWVDIRAYGSQFKLKAGYTNNHALFTGNLCTRFAIRGATLIGTGTEKYIQGLFYGYGHRYLWFEDIYAANVAACILAIHDSQYVWIQRNVLQNVTQANQWNAINLVNSVNGNTSPLKYLWVRDNVLTGVAAEGIAIVSQSGNRTDPVVDAHINKNIVECTSAGGWPIAVEQAGTAPGVVSLIDISGNTCIANNGGAYGIVLTNDSSPTDNNAQSIAEVTVSDNRVVNLAAGGSGIFSRASKVTIADNKINANMHDIVLQNTGSSVSDHVTITGNQGGVGSGDRVHNANSNNVDVATLTITGNWKVEGL